MHSIAAVLAHSWALKASNPMASAVCGGLFRNQTPSGSVSFVFITVKIGVLSLIAIFRVSSAFVDS